MDPTFDPEETMNPLDALRTEFQAAKVAARDFDGVEVQYLTPLRQRMCREARQRLAAAAAALETMAAELGVPTEVCPDWPDTDD